MRLLALVPLLFALAGCTCGSPITGAGDAAASDDGGVVPLTHLEIAPLDPVVEVVIGQAAPTVQFEGRAEGVAVAASFSIDRSDLGSLSTSGTFVASGRAGGRALVTARYGDLTASTSLIVNLRQSDNGGTNPDGGAGAGGWGGVGGEGVGGAVDPTTVQVLHSTPTADPGLQLLYPYDRTVWPRDVLAPLLQWRPGGRDYEAVLIQLTAGSYQYEGVFARTATPFLHHPIPQDVWSRLASSAAGSDVQLRVVLASGGSAFGPLSATWTIAPGSLKGTVYYNSYGTRLAKNYSGAIGGDGMFGGATLAIKGGSTDPALVAGGNGGDSQCRVCHAVSADGSRLVTQRGDNYDATSHYDLKSGGETALSPTDGRFAWGAPSPDGELLFSNAAPLAGSSSAPSALFALPSGVPVAATGLPAGLRAGMPAFSPDGSKLAFNWYAGSAGGSAGDTRSLATLDFAAPATFANFRNVYTPPDSGHRCVYPSFLPDSRGVVFQLETASNGRGFAETRSNCDASGSCSDVGAQGELWWLDLPTGTATRLDQLNGRGYLPTAANGHADDSTFNYEPTVGPVASGGYAWVVFTSRRLYGNVATVNPFWSDPRFHDLSQTPTTKKLWVAAVDLNATPGQDPSHPAFYVPAQELLAGNSRGYWVVDPCRPNGETCESGDQCCGGYCRKGGGELPRFTCDDQQQGACAQEFEKCSVSDDCCGAAQGMRCIGGRCTRMRQ